MIRLSRQAKLGNGMRVGGNAGDNKFFKLFFLLMGYSVFAFGPLFNPVLSQETIRVGYLSPEVHEFFWKNTLEAAESAADDLSIDLTTRIARDGSISIKRSSIALLNSEPKLDYFVTLPTAGVTESILKVAEEKGIKTILVNKRNSLEEKDSLGMPRNKYKHWLAMVSVNDIVEGYRLTDSLVRLHEKSGDRHDTGILAINGRTYSAVSVDRGIGLRGRVSESPNVRLLNQFYCDWRKKCASTNAREFLEKTLGTNVIWVANSGMALGVLEALSSSGFGAGQNLLIGTYDWPLQTLQAIKDGKIAVSFGGNFLEVAWALVLIRDFHEGIDFADTDGTIITTKLKAITQSNVDLYADFVENKRWSSTDFRNYSKFYNSNLKSYQFNVDNIVGNVTD